MRRVLSVTCLLVFGGCGDDAAMRAAPDGGHISDASPRVVERLDAGDASDSGASPVDGDLRDADVGSTACPATVSELRSLHAACSWHVADSSSRCGGIVSVGYSISGVLYVSCFYDTDSGNLLGAHFTDDLGRSHWAGEEVAVPPKCAPWSLPPRACDFDTGVDGPDIDGGTPGA